MTRRGFVMPIVLMLSIAIGLLAGIVLTRAGQRSAVVREQLASYQTSHRDRGIKEMVSAWIKYSADQDMASMIGGPGGGEAFTMRAGPNETITVRLLPAQDTARINPVGLNVSEGRVARRVETLLRERFGERGLAGRTREVGPASIDTVRAEDDVLAAIAEAVLDDGELAQRFVTQLRREPVTSAGLNPPVVRRACEALGIIEGQRDQLSMLMGPAPTLWRVRATWVRRDPMQRTPDRTEVYAGLVDLVEDGLMSFGTRHPSELFLEWGRVDEGTGYTDAGVPNERPGA